MAFVFWDNPLPVFSRQIIKYRCVLSRTDAVHRFSSFPNRNNRKNRNRSYLLYTQSLCHKNHQDGVIGVCRFLPVVPVV